MSSLVEQSDDVGRIRCRGFMGRPKLVSTSLPVIWKWACYSLMNWSTGTIVWRVHMTAEADYGHEPVGGSVQSCCNGVHHGA